MALTLEFPRVTLLIPMVFLYVIPSIVYADHSDTIYTVNNQTVPCFATQESQMCGFISNPWDAIKHALFVDYLGDWFVAVVYFPIISLVFILTRNFTYTGFVGMFIVIGTDQAESLPFAIKSPLH